MKGYSYEIQKVNAISGRAKDDAIIVYCSSSRLEIGRVYFNLPERECVAYRAIREVGR